jgi:hypothetical protein
LGRGADYSFHQRLSFLFCDYCRKRDGLSHFVVSVRKGLSAAKLTATATVNNASVNAMVLAFMVVPR